MNGLGYKMLLEISQEKYSIIRNNVSIIRNFYFDSSNSETFLFLSHKPTIRIISKETITCMRRFRWLEVFLFWQCLAMNRSEGPNYRALEIVRRSENESLEYLPQMQLEEL